MDPFGNQRMRFSQNTSIQSPDYWNQAPQQMRMPRPPPNHGQPRPPPHHGQLHTHNQRPGHNPGPYMQGNQSFNRTSDYRPEGGGAGHPFGGPHYRGPPPGDPRFSGPPSVQGYYPMTGSDQAGQQPFVTPPPQFGSGPNPGCNTSEINNPTSRGPVQQGGPRGINVGSAINDMQYDNSRGQVQYHQPGEGTNINSAPHVVPYDSGAPSTIPPPRMASAPNFPPHGQMGPSGGPPLGPPPGLPAMQPPQVPPHQPIDPHGPPRVPHPPHAPHTAPHVSHTTPHAPLNAPQHVPAHASPHVPPHAMPHRFPHAAPHAAPHEQTDSHQGQSGLSQLPPPPVPPPGSFGNGPEQANFGRENMGNFGPTPPSNISSGPLPPTEQSVELQLKALKQRADAPVAGQDAAAAGTASSSELLAARREQDKQWMTRWLQQRGKTRSSRKRAAEDGAPPITVAEAGELLREALCLLEKLGELRGLFEKQTAGAEKDLTKETEAASKIQERFKCIQNKLTEDSMSHLERKLQKNSKKRDRLRRRRKNVLEEKQEEEERRAIREQEIDQWRNQITEKELAAKKEKELKKQADELLGEVRRKRAECNRATELVKALRKLRAIRKDSGNRKGVHTSQAAEDEFDDTTEELLTMLKSQSVTYEEEQKTLQVMLDMEQEETLEKERLHQRHLADIKLKRQENNIRRMLFGKADKLEEDDTLYSYWQYYAAASQDLQSLLHTRREWDLHLVPIGTPGGSRLPPGWVIPVDPSDDKWATALKGG